MLGYLIGQLGNLLPLLGGIGGTEGALIGVFVLHGVGVTEATAAVLAHRLLQLAIPARLGAPRLYRTETQADAWRSTGVSLRAAGARRVKLSARA